LIKTQDVGIDALGVSKRSFPKNIAHLNVSIISRVFLYRTLIQHEYNTNAY
jgi:hypothetical protein